MNWKRSFVPIKAEASTRIFERIKIQRAELWTDENLFPETICAPIWNVSTVESSTIQFVCTVNIKERDSEITLQQMCKLRHVFTYRNNRRHFFGKTEMSSFVKRKQSAASDPKWTIWWTILFGSVCFRQKTTHFKQRSKRSIWISMWCERYVTAFVSVWKLQIFSQKRESENCTIDKLDCVLYHSLHHRKRQKNYARSMLEI